MENNIQRIPVLAVVGVGLIGGSFALAMKKAGLVDKVIGVGRGLANLEDALHHGVVDEITTDPASAIATCDCLMLATPVGQLSHLFPLVEKHLKPTAIVTDAGSTKGNVVGFAREHLKDRLPNFVPGHPIAGAEFSGAKAAKEDLYHRKHVVITPLAESSISAVAAVSAWWAATGADVRSMTPELHDQIFAAVSHLPHVLSFALVDMLANRTNGSLFFDFAASGFRDFTRIASSHPEMWRDICLANKSALLQEMYDYQAQLSKITALLEAANGAEIESIFATAREARNAWLHQKQQSLLK
ncbi:prephenate dehydrogenase/arogenate dehydrogenase family protein [Leeia sp. TBRC 13508]|uniref:Prephenate dehydrogenase/arogenate dehydrogenase family protein n=1 Tax=Leeia speluncae TaxID=2884804 RepID=A0ABS8D2L5_9NEIS|nr:prephenate dehydrogenase/arogenate dehydrogenase family protein [Leeia speluncae]MCB6182437.1 prephenate dehydrogenase/arogenate dehydrogenase family protein [Leeia speluncae]